MPRFAHSGRGLRRVLCIRQRLQNLRNLALSTVQGFE
jgi:hypothetical protein